jgi:glycosyltransferase involved in cell wall biosynthesis
MLSPKTVYRLFIRDDYDYEVAFLEGLSTRLVSASTNKKSRKIAWVHTDLISYPESYKVYKSESNEQKAYTRFDSVACVSNGVLESFVKKYGQVIPDIRTVYNILDEETIIKLSSEECEIRKSAPLIVSVGRLTKQKGFDRLLRVKKRLDDENVPSELWIVGEGEERSALESFIDEHKVRDVKLVGFEQNPYKFMAQADIFVSSSLAEGYSTVVTESVVLGVPVISTNTAGAGEPVQTPRCSVIVEDEDGLYNAIKEALTDKAVLDSLKNDAYNKRNFFKKERLLKDIKQFLKID